MICLAENNEKPINYPVPIEKEGKKLIQMEKKLQKPYLTN